MTQFKIAVCSFSLTHWAIRAILVDIDVVLRLRIDIFRTSEFSADRNTGLFYGLLPTPFQKLPNMASSRAPRNMVNTMWKLVRWNSASNQKTFLRVLDDEPTLVTTVNGLVIRRMHSIRKDMTSVPRWRAALTTLRGVDHVVDEEEARNFVVLLEPNERQLLLKELASFQAVPPSKPLTLYLIPPEYSCLISPLISSDLL